MAREEGVKGQKVMGRDLTDVSRERRLKAGLPLLALQGLDEGRLLPTDVGPRTPHHKHVKVIPRPTGVPPDQAVGVGLVDGPLEERRRRRRRAELMIHTFIHIADALFQSDLQYVQLPCTRTKLHFVWPEIEPATF